MITLKKLHLKNFLSHIDTELDFSESSRLLIDGNSGSGKSSLVEALLWVLYGEGRTENRNLVHKGKKKAEVSIILENDDTGVTTEIVRTATSGGKHTLAAFTVTKNGEREASPLTGIRELQAWIEKDLIGASYLLFVNSVVHTQDGGDLFVQQSAIKRKELLLEIVKANDFDEYLERTKAKLSELKTEEAQHEASLGELRSFVSSLEGRVASKPDLVKRIKELKETIANSTKQLEELEKKNDITMELNTEIRNLEVQKTQAEFDLMPLQQKLDEIRMTEEVLSKMDKVEEVLEEVRSEKEKKEKELDDIRIKIEEESKAEKKRKEYEAAKPDYHEESFTSREEFLNKQLVEASHMENCPSGDKCPYMSKRIQSLASISNSISELAKEKAAKKQAYDAWEIGLREFTRENTETASSIDLTGNMIALQKEVSELTRRYDELMVKKADKATWEALVAKKGEYIADHSKAEWVVADFKRQIEEKKKEFREFPADLTTTIRTVRGEVDRLNRELSREEAMLETIEGDEKSLSEFLARIKDIQKVKLPAIKEKKEKLESLKSAFGNNGIKSVVIDYMLPKLEDSINTILERLCDFQVRLDTQSEKASGEGVKEGLFIRITNDIGEELPYEAYSGGEKLKITVAISEALAGLQKVGFRAFDELFVGLDPESTESFAMVLERLQERFSQVMCISHLSEIKDLFENKLTCVKSNGITAVNHA